MPRFEISVIIPVYNAQDFVAEAVESALSQQEVREVILVEDGSSDQSLNLCLEASARSTKTRTVRHPDGANHGASASRNLGIKNASCPYLAFLDADDYFLPRRFKTTCEVFDQHSDAQGVYEAIGTTFMDPSVKSFWSSLLFEEITTVKVNVAPEYLFDALMREGAGHFSFDGFTAKRTVFSDNMMFNENLAMHEDTELMFRLSAATRLYPGSIIEPVAMRRVHNGNRIAGHLARKRDAYEAYTQVFRSLLLWGRRVLSTDQKRWLLHRYISHLRKSDYFDDFRWSDYVDSRSLLIGLLRNAPELLIDPYFWRRLIPSRAILGGR